MASVYSGEMLDCVKRFPGETLKWMRSHDANHGTTATRNIADGELQVLVVLDVQPLAMLIWDPSAVNVCVVSRRARCGSSFIPRSLDLCAMDNDSKRKIDAEEG